MEPDLNSLIAILYCCFFILIIITYIFFRSAIPEKEKSPPRPPSILKKRPMAALRTEKITEKIDKPVLEYRIIVSNLRSTVTGGDIEVTILILFTYSTWTTWCR